MGHRRVGGGARDDSGCVCMDRAMIEYTCVKLPKKRMLN